MRPLSSRLRSLRALDARFVAGFTTALEPVEIVRALDVLDIGGRGVRLAVVESGRLVVEDAADAARSVEVRLDERATGGSRVTCRAAQRPTPALRGRLSDLAAELERIVRAAESASVSPYARTGWLPPAA